MSDYREEKAKHKDKRQAPAAEGGGHPKRLREVRLEKVTSRHIRDRLGSLYKTLAMYVEWKESNRPWHDRAYSMACIRDTEASINILEAELKRRGEKP